MEDWIKDTYRLAIRSESIEHVHFYIRKLPVINPRVYLLSVKSKSPFRMQDGIDVLEKIKNEDQDYDE